jgi:hypothetical protein
VGAVSIGGMCDDDEELIDTNMWNRYLDIMRPFGKIYPLTVTTEDLVIPFLPLLTKEISFVGSCTSTRKLLSDSPKLLTVLLGGRNL